MYRYVYSVVCEDLNLEMYFTWNHSLKKIILIINYKISHSRGDCQDCSHNPCRLKTDGDYDALIINNAFHGASLTSGKLKRLRN